VKLSINKVFIWVLFLTAIFGPHNLRANEKPSSKDNKPYNIIMICLDTLRADHTGCYGYFRNTSPNLDIIAKRGVIFEQAFAQSSFTVSSFASIFTSQYVNSHGVDTIEKKLAENQTTLAQVFQQHGYKTAAFIYNAIQLAKEHRLNKGFDLYEIEYDSKNRSPSFVFTMPQAIRWIQKNKDNKFFVFLHSNDIHEPYHCPQENIFGPTYRGRLDKEYLGWSEKFCRNNLHRSRREIEHIVAHYDAGIKYADRFLPALMWALDQFGLKERTILVIFSDHGEILSDRGAYFCHGWGVSEVELHVPLIIVIPGMDKKGSRIDAQIQLIDIMPTLFDLVGFETVNIPMEGKSLRPLIEGRQDNNLNQYVYAECFKGESEKIVTFNNQKVFNVEMMVRTPEWKLVSSVWHTDADLKTIKPREVIMRSGVITLWPKASPAYRLYNLKEDPEEKHNLIEKAPLEIKLELLEKLMYKFQ
jgi:arylsulfatase